MFIGFEKAILRICEFSNEQPSSEKEGAQMNQTKTRKKFYTVILLGMLGMAIFQLVSPVNRPQNINSLPQTRAVINENETIETPRYASGVHLTAGICALILVGYLFWFMIRKFQNDSRAEINARMHPGGRDLREDPDPLLHRRGNPLMAAMNDLERHSHRITRPPR